MIPVLLGNNFPLPKYFLHGIEHVCIFLYSTGTSKGRELSSLSRRAERADPSKGNIHMKCSQSLPCAALQKMGFSPPQY